MARPKLSREPAFQLMMVFVHGFCAVICIGGAIYHSRRLGDEDAKDD